MTLKRLTITATQTVGGETVTNVMQAPAKWTMDAEGVTVTYDEQGDMQGTTTTLTVAGDTVALTRRGVTQTDMRFTAKKRHAFDYDTAVGVLKLSSVTETVESDFTEDGGRLTLRYRLYADGTLFSKNEMVIEIE